MKVTNDHIALMSHLRFDWDDECEWGAVSSDPKRPFGNSDVVGDVSEIVGRRVDLDEARQLSIEMAALVQQAVLAAVSEPTAAGICEGASLALPWRAERLLRVSS